ncbi:MAG: tetratricopeptide repeat protein [Sulfuricaulis sp.]
MKPNRNEPCPCGSGKKFKRCCERVSIPQSSLRSAEVITLPDSRVVSITAAIQVGVEYHQAGRLRKAQAIYDSILRVQPDNPDALHLLGLISRQTGNFQLALTLIGQAIKLKPDTALFHNNLGETFRSLGRYTESIAESSRALELQSNLPEAYYNLGMALDAVGRLEEAAQDFRRAITVKPRFVEAYLGLSQTLNKLRCPDEALACLRTASECCPGNLNVACALGITLRSQGKVDEAIQHYRQAIEVYPKAYELFHNLAIAYRMRGALTLAAECFRKALELCPHDETAWHMLHAIEHTNSERAPAAYIRETFDYYAQNFDEHLVKKLEYGIPVQLGNAVRDNLAGRHNLDTVDLGCGTGLLGSELRSVSRSLVGVDLSPKMIDKARERSIYDRLIVGDLIEFITQLEVSSVDVAAAADVFIYIGKLDEVFEQCYRILRQNGIFAFSLEALDERDFALQTTGRYAQSLAYIAMLCNRLGFRVAHREDVDIRKEKDQPVPGYLFVLVKPNA